MITTLGTLVPAGTHAEIDLDVTTPNVTEETPIFEELTLSDGGAARVSLDGRNLGVVGRDGSETVRTLGRGTS